MRIAFFGDSLTSGIPGSSYFAILKKRFPEHTLVNFGKVNDTVVSLYRRISSMQIDPAFDIAFLWIGVNDVPPPDRWLFRAFNALIAQPRARDTQEFRTCYRATLDLLCGKTAQLIVVPPALKGENLENGQNHRLVDLAALIKDLTSGCARATFLDLQAAFTRELAEAPGTDHHSKNPTAVLLDVLTLRSDKQIDSRAMERGLRLTIDGVHLNSVGARLVAEEFAAVIQAMTPPSATSTVLQ